MKSSVRKDTIFRHGYIDLSDLGLDLPIGDLLLNFSNGRIYSKDVNSTYTTLGNSYHKLIEYDAYALTSNYRYSNQMYLRGVTVDGKLKLSSTIGSLYLNDLSGINLEGDLTNSYLGFNDDLVLSNVNEPTFSIQSLADVLDGLALEANNNYVLTLSYIEYDPSKEPFKDHYYGRYDLKPEISRIRYADDIAWNNSATSNYIIRSYIPSENHGLSLGKVDPLRISWDINPYIMTNLECDGHSITNLNYKTNNINLTDDIEYLSINVTNSTSYTINCTDNVIYITMSFDNDDYINTNKLKLITIFINNFKGAIQFTDNVEFENGLPLVLEGDHHILCVFSYVNINGKLKIKLSQRATHLSSVK